MNTITIHGLSLQFDGSQITHGKPEDQASQAIALINAVLQREPFGLSAQLIATNKLNVCFAMEPPCEGCGGKGWLDCNTGNDQSPKRETQRCDLCRQYDTDQDAQKTAQKGEPPNP